MPALFFFGPLLPLVVAFGCSDGGSAPADAGISFDASRPDAPWTEPLAPGAPEAPRGEPALATLPVMTPCPKGWREIDVDGVAACDPWPETGRAACTGAEAHFTGEPGCRRVGTECPMDGWPAGLPGSGVLYVRAGAPAGGLGTRAEPFGTIGEATLASVAGDTIAVAVGAYPEEVDVPAGVTLFGACASGTTLGDSSLTGWIVSVLGPDVAVRNVRVTGGAGVEIAIAGSSATLRDVAIEDVAIAGVNAFDSDVVLEDVVVRRVRGAASGANGRGIHAFGGMFELRRVVVESAHELGVFFGSAVATLEDVAVIGTEPQESDGARGSGMHVQGGSRVDVERAAFEENHRIGIIGGGDGVRIALIDVVVGRTRPSDDAARGVTVESGGELVLSRVRVHDHAEAGITLSDATLDASDVIVATVGELGSDVFGRGIAFEQGVGTMSRILVMDTTETAIHVSGLSTEATLSDLVTRRSRDGVPALTAGGTGLAVQLGAVASAARVLAEDAEGVGLFVGGADTDLTLTDLIVRSSDEGSPRLRRGIDVAFGARAHVERALVEGYEEIGVFTQGDGAFLHAEDIRLRDAVGDGSLERLGRGIGAQEHSVLEVFRAHIEGVAEAALACIGPDASCTVRDVRIDEVRPRADGTFGRGLMAQSAGELQVTRAHVERATEIGVAAQGLGTIVRVEDLVVRETRSGLDDHFGRAVAAHDGARLEIERALLERNHEICAGAFEGAELAMTETVIRDTLARPCAGGGCEGFGAGIGAGGYLGGHVSLRRFVIERSALAGLQIARDGAVDATGGVIRDNPIGANVQIPGYDLTRVGRDVRYVDNGQNLDATELGVPEAGP